MNTNTVNVRWFDGYLETFKATEVRFGNFYLWMRLSDGQNRHIPLHQVRWFSLSKESHAVKECDYCDGCGYIDGSDGLTEIKCWKCEGTGKLKQTNEEWFATLTTKEKAEAISRLNCYQGNIYEIEKWLKQPQREE